MIWCPRVAHHLPIWGWRRGGLMRQEIYEDGYGIDAWDTSTGSRCFVHIVNSVQLLHLTGCQAAK